MKEKLKYTGIFLLITLCFALLNAAFNLPLALSLFCALCFGGYPLVPAAVAFLLSFAVTPSVQMIIAASVMTAVIASLAAVYRKKEKVAGAEIALYIFAACAVYIVTGEGKIYLKLVYTSIIALFSLVCAEAVRLIKSSSYTEEMSVAEGACLSLFICALFFGLNNLVGIDIYKGVAVFFILAATKLRGKSYALAGVLCAPLAVVDPAYAAVFLCYALGVSLFMGVTPFLAALAPVGVEFLLYTFTDIYSSFDAIQGVSLLIGGLLFALIPSSVYSSLVRLSPKSAENVLTKEAISRTRGELSAKLYDLAEVFSGMNYSIEKLRGADDGPDVKKIVEKTLQSCKSCSLYNRCARANFPSDEEMTKIIELGVAKGRVTLVDLTKQFLDGCGYPNGMIFEINKAISENCEKIREKERSRETTEILALFAKGVSDCLKDTAFRYSSPASVSVSEEKAIYKKLRAKGISVRGLLVTGEGKEKRISVYAKNTADGKMLAEALSKAVNEKIALSSVTPVLSDGAAFSFVPSPPLDAVFGVNSVTKYASEACGDAHSLIKLDRSKFLVALSDGMGSGKTAQDTTDAALTLIESFYRAGISSEAALKLVNKILSAATDDNFSAVDIAVTNLNDGACDFIKIGAPYGFIVSEEGLKFIEGSSLPLGILDDLRPATANAVLSDGDMVLMLSDGVTDSFASSSEFIEFLKTAPRKNPQALCDSVIRRALDLSGGVAQDDMTAVCVRIFKAI